MVGAACSAQSLAIAEPLVGSAGEVSAFVAFSWPKPLWHHDKAALSEGVPAQLGRIEDEHKRARRKLALRMFQREAQSATDRVELIAVQSDGRSLHVHGLPTGELAQRIERFLAGEQPGPALETRQILACTDGRHDRCCAAFGRGFFEALREAAGRSGARIALAESSHLGGHRMAATCVSLPAGRMYGRLRAEHARELLAAESRERVLLAHYRGNLFLSELAQVAEAALLLRFPGARALKLDPGADGCVDATLEADGAEHRLSVRCERSEFSSAISCGEELESRSRWIAVETRQP